MTEHFSRSTVSSAFWCGKCQKQTQHRIDGVRKGPCLECIIKLEAQHLGIPVAMRNGELAIRCTDATFDLLMQHASGNRVEIEVPPMCSCAQRPYPHDLSAHRKLFESPGSYDAFDERIRFAPEGMRWPWSLRFAQETEA